MHTLSYWFGFLGAWLLVAGPNYQASVELRAEQELTARVQQLMKGAPEPPQVSSWWWLLPPIRLLLSSQRREDSRQALLASLSAEDLRLVTRYMNIARGWVLVGSGAFLIALKETYELAEHHEWPTWAYWLIAAAMLFVAIAITVASARRERSLHARQQG
jgi:hypothetical protein